MVGFIIAVVVIVVILAIFLFTRTNEGTAQAIMTFGGLWKIVMCWNGRKLNEKGDVVAGEDSNLPGGLRFGGIRWINKIYKYGFRWADYELKEGGKRELQFHEKKINYINLKPDVFAVLVHEAETKGIIPGITPGEEPETVKVTAVFLWTAQVFNPAKALFESPPNWNENATTLLSNLFTRWIGVQKLDYLISLRAVLGSNNKPIQLWEAFKDDPLFDQFKEWGFKTLDNGISLGDLKFSEDIEKALEVQKKQELEAKGTYAATAGVILQSMAPAYGKKTSKEMAEMIAAELPGSALRKEYMDWTIEMAIRKQSGDFGALRDIRVQGAGSGAEQVVYNALAILGDKLGGQGAKASEKVVEEKPKTEEEKRKELKSRIRGKLAKNEGLTKADLTEIGEKLSKEDKAQLMRGQ